MIAQIIKYLVISVAALIATGIVIAIAIEVSGDDGFAASHYDRHQISAHECIKKLDVEDCAGGYYFVPKPEKVLDECFLIAGQDGSEDEGVGNTAHENQRYRVIERDAYGDPVVSNETLDAGESADCDGVKPNLD